jgi:hypothetical protein
MHILIGILAAAALLVFLPRVFAIAAVGCALMAAGLAVFIFWGPVPDGTNPGLCEKHWRVGCVTSATAAPIDRNLLPACDVEIVSAPGALWVEPGECPSGHEVRAGDPRAVPIKWTPRAATAAATPPAPTSIEIEALRAQVAEQKGQIVELGRRLACATSSDCGHYQLPYGLQQH